MSSNKGDNGYIDREASKLPFVRCKFDGGVVPVKIGVVGWIFIIATLGAISGVAGFAPHVIAGKTNEKNIKIMYRNSERIDENQRVSDQRDKFMIMQLDAIIKADPDIDGPTKLPLLEPSKLEPLQ